MKSFAGIIALIFFSLLFFTGCARRQNFIPFYAFIDEYERDVFVDAGGFPDSVAFSFFSDDFDLNSAYLTEIVDGYVDSLCFSAFPVIVKRDMLAILEDYSGSMLEYLAFADTVVLHILRQWDDGRAVVIRFARGYDVVAGPATARVLAISGTAHWRRPSVNGTDLAMAMFYVADSFINNLSAVVIVTDGSVYWDTPMKNAVEKFRRNGVPVFSVQVCDGDSRTLGHIARLTNGIYLPHYKWRKIGSALSNAWVVKYSPAVTDTNGEKHQVILRWGSQKRSFSYVAPGSPKQRSEVTQRNSSKNVNSEVISVLVEGVRIPFFESNNSKLLPEAIFLLDSVVRMIEALPDTFSPTIIVDGYTCDIGGPEFNKKLSERRSKVVSHYIMEKCSRPVRVIWRGLGETCPLLPNTNEENRRVNRRAEVRLVL